MAQAPVVASYKNGNNTLNTAIAGVAVLISLGAMFWQAANPKGDVNQLRYDIRDDLRRSEERTDRGLAGFALELKTVLTKDQHDEFARRKDKDTDILRDEISRLRSDQVTRNEHQQHWNEIADRFVALRSLLADEQKAREQADAEMRKEFGSTWTAADQMKNLQDQIKQLQQRLDGWQKPGTSVTPTTAGIDSTRIR